MKFSITFLLAYSTLVGVSFAVNQIDPWFGFALLSLSITMVCLLSTKSTWRIVATAAILGGLGFTLTFYLALWLWFGSQRDLVHSSRYIIHSPAEQRIRQTASHHIFPFGCITGGAIGLIIAGKSE